MAYIRRRVRKDGTLAFSIGLKDQQGAWCKLMWEGSGRKKFLPVLL